MPAWPSAELAYAPAPHTLYTTLPEVVSSLVSPALVLTGALSSLLWRDTATRLGVTVGAMRFTRVGVRVGLPA